MVKKLPPAGHLSELTPKVCLMLADENTCKRAYSFIKFWKISLKCVLHCNGNPGTDTLHTAFNSENSAKSVNSKNFRNTHKSF